MPLWFGRIFNTSCIDIFCYLLLPAYQAFARAGMNMYKFEILCHNLKCNSLKIIANVYFIL